MTCSLMSFAGWAIFMIASLVGLFILGRRTSPSQQKMEDVASSALPRIGGIAEKHHSQRFGRPPTNAPGRKPWYPEVPKKYTKHA